MRNEVSLTKTKICEAIVVLKASGKLFLKVFAF